MRFGVVASAYANCHLKKGAQPIPPGRWFGIYEPKPEQTDEQMLSMMREFTDAHNKSLKE